MTGQPSDPAACRRRRRTRPSVPAHSRCRRPDRGAVAVEMALGIPMLLIVALLSAFSYTAARANLDVQAAAAAAARAASQARTPTQAQTAAVNNVNANLAGRCTTHHTRVDTSHFGRGGSVTVTISCTVSIHALNVFGLPGTATQTAAATSPVDLYRSLSLSRDDSTTTTKDGRHD